MKFSIPTNWDSELLKNLRKKEEIAEVYGKLAQDFFGGGRAAFLLPPISKKRATRQIKEIQRQGLSFNYLLNSVCMDNLEWTSSGQRKINHFLDWLSDVGVGAVTVSIPYLLQLIKKRFPKMKISVSTQACVNSAQKAKYWEDLGADLITLSVVDANRDFRLIRAVRKSVKCQLQVIGNLNCLYGCPFYLYHGTTESHASQSHHQSGGFLLGYCHLNCRSIQLANPINFIRSSWIRPEDVHYYEEAGIDRIKLVERNMTTQALLNIIRAYLDRRYTGNLVDLLPGPAKSIVFQKNFFWSNIRFFFHPFKVNILKLLKRMNVLEEARVFIDNSKLDGFLEQFIKESCYDKSCQECGYCEEVAKKAVFINAESKQKMSAVYDRYMEDLLTGDIFSYVSKKR